MSRQQPAADAVPLDALANEKKVEAGADGGLLNTGGLLNFKILVALFVLFALVVSDVFTNNVISGFRGAVQCRTPTSFGVVLQGTFLVLFYVVALHMIDGGIV